MKKLPLQTLIFSAVLAAFSAVVQLVHVGYQSPQWGMWIDIVAVSWLVAFFLYGIRSAFIVSLLGALVITLFAPDTWLGASMKWVATVPILIALFVSLVIAKKTSAQYKNISLLILPLIVGIIIRCLIVIPLNYFYAIPIWTKMTPAEAMQAIPWYIIAGFNAVQTIVDVALAWLLVFKFKLSRYGNQPETTE